jgi:hypothetical protein
MSAPIIPHLVHTMGRRVSSQSPSSVALATQRIDQTPALSDILCKRKRRLSSLLNAHSLALSVIKRAISFGLSPPPLPVTLRLTQGIMTPRLR